MIKFRQKNFGGSVKKGWEYIKKNPTLPLSTATLGISGANLGVNLSRKKEAQEQTAKQLEVLNKQINIISDNTKALRENSKIQKETISINKPPQQKKKRFKLFSIKSDAIAGAEIGLGLGSGVGLIFPKGIQRKPTYKFRKLDKPENFGGLEATSEFVSIDNKTKAINSYNKLSPFQRNALNATVGMIIGAALGALVGTVKEIDNRLSRRSVNGDRLMKTILENLKKDHFKEGTDFTRDPKLADFLQTKVCVAVSRGNGDLRILINTKSDPKLRDITDRITRNIPNAGVKNTFANNKYNELTITTISDSSADATLVSGIVSQFIHSGYPVYLVEVG